MAGAALTQLTDMGIPYTRAKAALHRTKGDVMSAAERVFSGEFDAIMSDDDDNENNNDHDMDVSSSGTPLKTSMSVDNVTANDMTDSGYKAEHSEAEDDEDDYEDLGGTDDDGFGYDDMSDGEPAASDPYAGIFFLKDRVEEVIEPIPEQTFVSVSIPGKAAKKLRILGRGEWMSGCPEGGEQSFLFQLYNSLEEGSLPCPYDSCKHSYTRKKQDFFALFPTFPDYIAYLASIVRPECPVCGGLVCLACGEKVGPGPGGGGKEKGKGIPIQTTTSSSDCLTSPPAQLLHCPNLQGIILGLGLYMIDSTFSTGKVETAQVAAAKTELKATPPSKKRKKELNPKSRLKSKVQPDEEEDENCSDGPNDEDCGYGGTGTSTNKGTGYSGHSFEDRSGQIEAEKTQLLADRSLSDLLLDLRPFLPNMERPGGPCTSDYLVHPTALAHLRRHSSFANDLLRNDSLLDMSKRGVIYRALFDWLEVVSTNESLASMLGMPQMRPARSASAPGLLGSVSVTYEGAPSLRELLESVVIQAQAALRGLQHVYVHGMTGGIGVLTEEELRTSKKELEMKKGEVVREAENDESSVLKAFCLRIVKSAETIDKRLVETKGKAFVQRMKEQLPRLAEGKAEVVEGKDASDEGMVKMYEEWATRARFQYVEMQGDAGTSHASGWKHHFSKQIRQLEGNNIPKRSLAIAKELAILTTNLPVAWHSTIFLRVDEARVDVLKAMITGPEGTPYQNGCFLFDIFLPSNYNQQSPSVHYMTTNGGRYRYNPNLYAEGKVCLSLLGTWQGPGWVAGQSTLLQVLISIQSLILCDEPFCNEPGWAKMTGTAQSKAYSANVRRMVLVDAMANNIKNPPFPFETEIKTHFRLKANNIREQLKQWRELDDGRSVAADSYTADPNHTRSSTTKSFDKAADEVRRLLDELEGINNTDGFGTGKTDESKGKKNRPVA